MVELKKMVTFITAVINSTMNVKSKSERTQIIVKAAECNLGLSGLSWEEVSKDLYYQARPGQARLEKQGIE